MWAASLQRAQQNTLPAIDSRGPSGGVGQSSLRTRVDMHVIGVQLKDLAVLERRVHLYTAGAAP